MNKLINRKVYLDKLSAYRDIDIIKVITGMRRSGKSTLLHLLENDLLNNSVKPEQIQFYNFELPEQSLNKSWETIYFEIKSRAVIGKMNYVLLDEIQTIPNFEKMVDGLFASEGFDIYVTGSNASLLSGELATLLSGRYIEISILPFSFAEYLEYRQIDFSVKYLNYETLFYDYVNETSLPKGIELRDAGYDKIFEYLNALVNTVIEKDITQRYQIRDRRAFENMVKFLASSIGSQISPASISRALKADNQTLHHATVEKYIHYLMESFIFYKVHRFDIKGKRQLATLEKYYLSDPGLLNILLGRERTSDRGHILENVVYLELRRRSRNVWTGSLRNAEIDFIAKDPSGNIEYYQVAWEIPNSETDIREFGPLEKIRDNYPKYLLSSESFPQSKAGIIHKNVFEWLLDPPTPN